MASILDGLPPFYRTRVSPLLEREIPDETKATCSNCAMCDTSKSVPAVDGKSRLFRSDTKCCTYHPKLPNYLIGALLSDASPEMSEGQRRVREKISKRVSVSPQWLRPPSTYTWLYNQARDAFGRTESLRCPYFETTTGGCTIWRHREAVCSTYFCRYENGDDGHAQWMQTKSYLGLLEQQLARYALLTLMPDYITQGRDDSPTLSGADLDERVDETAYAALWGAWAGKEEGFYRSCFELVSALDATGVERLLGLDGTIAIATLDKRLQDASSDVLPKTLTWNPNATVRWLPDGTVALGSYSDLDAVALDGSAYAMLVAFDGTKTVDEVRGWLRSEKQSDIAESVLMTLYRHRILR